MSTVLGLFCCCFQVERCGPEICPPFWAVDEWSECPQTCGGGLQRRKVTCKKLIEGLVAGDFAPYNASVEDNECSILDEAKPPSERFCVPHTNCAPEWRVDQWSSCTKTCGMGERQRTVTCIQQIFNGTIITLDDEECLVSRRKPREVGVCSRTSCPARWEVGRHGSCTRSCGGGTQVALVTCMQLKGTGLDESVSESYCSALEQPSGRRQCNTTDCPAVWETDPWTTCSLTCGGGARTRTIRCEQTLANGTVVRVSDTDCPASSAPVTLDDCQVFDCPAEWSIRGVWSACSHTCGGLGEQSRPVVCQQRKLTGLEVVTAEECDAALMPADVQECQREDCPAFWTVGEFTQCDRTCAGGTQRRSVTCRALLASGKEARVDEARCVAEDKPNDVQDCNSFDCRPVWRADPWLGCNQTCGRGLELRNVVCHQLRLNADDFIEVADDECDAAQKPITQRYCSEVNCDPVWFAYQFAVCPVSCGGGIHSRRVVCQQLRGDGQLVEVSNSLCPPAVRPTDTQTCGAVNCPAQWRAELYDDCSVECGGGEQSRLVLCEVLQANSVTVQVEDTDCIQGDKPIVTRPCQVIDCPPYWNVSTFVDCSVSCGGGEQSRQVICQQLKADGVVVRVPGRDCRATEQPADTRTCNVVDCPALWRADSFEQCSRTCGNGTQSRRVICERVTSQGQLVTISSSLCDPAAMPHVMQRCSEHDCPPIWITTPWSECTLTCGQGTRARSVMCEQTLQSGEVTLVDDNNCPTSTRPGSEEFCNEFDCVPEWLTGDFNTCSKTCGNGSQSREVICQQRQRNGIVATVTDTSCPPVSQPTRNRRCNVVNCPAYWTTTPYSVCSRTCSGGNQNRIVGCQQIQASGELAEVSALRCVRDVGTQPPSQRECNVHDCPPIWINTEWSACSITCGNGTQTRRVTCQQTLINDVIITVEDSRCPQEAQPPAIQRCREVDCRPEWFADVFEPCSKSCGNGSQSRRVVCQQLQLTGKLVDVADGQCSDVPPASSQFCSLSPCPAVYRIGEWGQCSQSCSGGIQRRSVACEQIQATGNLIDVSLNLCVRDDGPLPAAQRECQVIDCPPIWITSEWLPCGLTCGLGTRSRQVLCEQTLANKTMIFVDGDRCPSASEPIALETCNAFNCDAVWVTDEFTECSKTCGNGTQSRPVYCEQRQADGVTRRVTEDLCNADAMPRVNQRCHQFSCPPIWISENWSQCTKSCGNGTRDRVVYCQQTTASGSLIKVDDDDCVEAGVKPAVQDFCSEVDCTPRWEVEPWIACNVTCGGGSQTRVVNCRQLQASGGDVTVPDRDCSEEKPAVRRECSRIDCKPEWRAFSYNPCDVTCGGSEHSRRVVCEQLKADSRLVEVPRAVCPQDSEPASVRRCGEADCASVWSAKQYTPCSVSCGGGLQTRDVLCEQLLGTGSMVVVPNSFCQAEAMPVTERRCEARDCPPQWNVSSYGECSVTCGGGEQFRTVECRQLQADSLFYTIDDDLCVVGDRPREVRECQAINCPACWNTRPYSSCSVSCGGGSQTRDVFCEQLQADGELRVVAGTVCDQGPCVMPNSTRACRVEDCPPYWVVDAFTSCSVSCGGGSQSRTVGCRQLQADGVTRDVSTSLCEPADEPVAVQECQVIDCPPLWDASDFSACTVSCGGGTRQRTVICEQVKSTGQLEVVPDVDCVQADMPARIEPCNVVNCPPEWEALPYLPCPVSCGGDIRTRTVRCTQLLGDGNRPIVADESCDLVPENVRPVGMSVCGDVACPPHWTVQPYLPCSVSCGGGVQSRTVACEQLQGNGTQLVILPELCPISLMPIATRECQVVKCPPFWQVSDFTECTNECGGGTQTRTVVCMQEQERGDVIQVDSSICSELPEPPSQQECNVIDCTPVWRVEPYTECSLTCGNGSQSRVVICEQLIANGNTIDVSDLDCDAPKPATDRRCSQVDCVAYWRSDAYQECSLSCGGGTQVRVVECEQLQGSGLVEVISDDLCVAASKPAVIRDCNVVECPAYWNTTEFSACTESCGLGTQTRRVFCHQVQPRGALTVVDNVECDSSVSPVSIQDCSVNNCPPEWVALDFNQCSRSCGNGSQSRVVFCQQRLSNGTTVIVPDGDCVSALMPSRVQRCQEINCPEFWEVGEYGQCTVECGGGAMVRSVVCMQLQASGNTLQVISSSCPQPMPIAIDECNVINCPPYWNTSDYNTCSVSCGGGSQSRRVFCHQVQSTGDLIIVDDDICIDLVQPISIRACSVVDCPTQWRSEAYSECSLSCGNGTQFRVVLCEQLKSDGLTVVLTDANCDAATMPQRQRRCSEVNCPAKWRADPFEQCSESCGGGLQQRNVACEQIQASGELISVGDTLCDGLLRPVSIQACQEIDCPPLWRALAYNACNVSCGGGIQTRVVICEQLRGDGITSQVDDGDCVPSDKPAVARECNAIDCTPVWRANPFTECSLTCGGGTQTRTIVCEQLLGTGETVERDFSECAAGDRPVTEQVCNSVDCSHVWVAGLWSPCTLTCGRGSRTRAVHCEQLLGNMTLLSIPDSECEASQMPPRTEVCNAVNCPFEWAAELQFSACSRSCGTGEQSRDVWCQQLQSSGSLEVVHTLSCNPDDRPVSQRFCNEIQCPSVWRTTAWGACSLSCGGTGAQQRRNYCETTLASGEITNTTDDDCLATSPPVVRDCIAPNCAPLWVSYPFGPCSRSCAGGAQDRLVRCEQLQSSGQQIVVGLDQCTEERPVLSQACNVVDCPGLWRPLFWGSCSKTCASGQQTRRVLCEQRKASGNVEVVLDDICDASQRPDDTQLCNIIDCEPLWLSDPWSPCSTTCGAGTQTRLVRCTQILADTSLSTLLNTRCVAADRPVNTRPCFEEACAPTFRTGPFGACSTSCGSQGLQSRTVLCQQDLEGGEVVTMEDTECKDDKPDDLQPCDRIDCPSRWFTSAYTSCSEDCGGGLESREVECRMLRATGDDDRLLDTECQQNGRRPRASRVCNQQSCPARYEVDAWQACSVSCGTGGVRRRRVHCKQKSTSGDNFINSYACVLERLTRPAVQEVCELERCPPKWSVDSWQACSHSCGGDGVQIRVVQCRYDDNGEVTTDSACSSSLKPAVSRSCSQVNCPAEWATSPWTQCSESCGGGRRTRTVGCEVLTRSGQRVPVGTVACERYSERPAREEECNAIDCPARYVYGQWGVCSATCGGGVERRPGTCEKVTSIGAVASAPGECPEEVSAPFLTRSCNTNTCPGVRIATEWGACSQTCGYGVQSREVYCVDSGDTSKRVDESRCLNSGELLTQVSCYRGVCPLSKADWKAGNWGLCTRSCGAGEQQRDVKCVRKSDLDGSTVITDPRECDQNDRPGNSRPCNQIECPGEWVPANDYSSCSVTCGIGIEIREYQCRIRTASGIVVSNRNAHH